MATIVHISCDFPDVLVPRKTPAIKQLVDGTPEHRHIVYSLNRVNGLHGVECLEFEPDRIAVAYRAPPKGLFLKTRMAAVAQSLVADVRRRSLQVDLVHAHKLTIDGLAASSVANALGAPVAFSIQGDSDLKVIGARPDLAGSFAAQIKEARVLFPFAPWAEAAIAKRFPDARSKMRRLPVAPFHDALSPAPVWGQPRLVSVFHLDSWARKNLPGMAAAVMQLAARIPDIRLEVIGGGSPKSLLAARDVVRRIGANERIAFLGPISNDRLPSALKQYAAFVLPTRRESYGLAHVEALFAGLPILLSRNMGIDGLLPQEGYAVACQADSIASIAEGIEKLIDRETEAKLKLASAQLSGSLDHLRRGRILAVYRDALQAAIAGRPAMTSRQGFPLPAKPLSDQGAR